MALTLTLRSISVSFGAVRALERIDIEVPAGTRTVLVGPSGSGKTTLLRVVAGLIDPDDGDVLSRSKWGIVRRRKSVGGMKPVVGPPTPSPRISISLIVPTFWVGEAGISRMSSCRAKYRRR